MELFIAIVIFILGTAVGSFLSSAIYRLRHNKKGFLLGRSIDSTTKNGQTLKWWHLIPIISFLILRGRSAFTGKKISVHYILLEIVTGLSFLTIFLFWNFLEPVSSTVDPTFLSFQINWPVFQQFLFYIIEFTLLIGIFFYDLLYKEIPDSFSLPAIAVAVAGGLVTGTVAPLDMLFGGIAIFLFFLLQYVVSKGSWIGGGDLRMGLLVGILLGWEKGLLALAIAYILGALLSIVLLALKKVNRKTQIAFGPFLIFGVTAMIFFGDTILNYYLNTFTF